MFYKTISLLELRKKRMIMVEKRHGIDIFFMKKNSLFKILSKRSLLKKNEERKIKQQ